MTWKPEYEKYVRIHWGWTQSPDWTWFSRVRAALSQMLTAETVVYDWQHIKSKALVIGGAKDTPQYPEQARHVAESIPGAQLELIENVGHVPAIRGARDLSREGHSVLEVPVRPVDAIRPEARVAIRWTW